MGINLEVLQLSGVQAKIYQTLLVSGQLSRAELSVHHQMADEAIDGILDELVQKKLARRIPGMSNRYAALLPLGSTKDELEAASAEVAILGRQIDETASSEMNRLKEQLQQATDEFKTKTNQELQNLDSQVSQLASTVSSEKIGQDERIVTNIQLQKENVDQTISLGNSNINEKVAQFKSSGSSRIASKQEGLNKSATEAKTQQDTINQTATDGLEPLDLAPVEQIGQETTIGVSNILTDMSSKVAELNNKSIEIVGNASNLVQEGSTILETTSEKFVSEVNSQLRTSASQLDEAIRMRVLQFDRMQDEWKNNLDSQKQVIAGTSSDIDSHYGASISTISSSSSSLQEMTGSLESQVAAELDKVNSNTDEILDASSEAIRVHLETVQQQVSDLLSNEISTVRSTLQHQMDVFLEQTGQQLQERVAAFAASLQTTKGNIDSQREDMKSAQLIAMRDQIEGVKRNLSGVVNSTHTAYDAKVAEVNSTLQDSQTALKSKMDQSVNDLDRMTNETGTLVDGSKQRLEDWNTQVQDQIRKQTSGLDEKLTSDVKDHIGAMTSSIEEQIATLQTNAAESLTTIQNQLTELTNTSNQSIEATLQSLQATLQTISQNMENRLKTALAQATQSYHGLIDSQTTSGQELITQLAQDVDIIEQDILSSMQASLSDLQGKITASLGTVQTEMQSTLSSAFDSVSQQVSGAKDIGTSVLQSIEALGSSGTSAQLQAVQTTFDTYGQKYNESTNRVSTKVSTLATLLDSLFKMQEETDTPKLTSTHVVGKTAIIRYMMEMVSRVKSKMTILAPDVSMISDDKILALPRTSQITIVSKIDTVTHKDWIDKMHGATANVTLRTLTEQGFGAQLPDFIGCEREGEEIIIGTLDEGNQDYVAIASNSENFVKIFGSQIISEYSRGRSKQLQK